MTISSDTRVVVLHAEDAPMPGVASPGTHQRYRQPHLSLEERRLGQLADHNVRVEMMYAGVCGTDLHLVQTDSETGYVLTSAPASIPARGRILGHEGVGRVVETGNSVQYLRPGDVVAFESIHVCRQCRPCLRENYNQCHEATLVGMQEEGLFGTIVDLPAALAHDVSAISDSDAGLRAAACLEPAGVALLACESLPIRAGDRVLVCGGGPIGIYCAMLCCLAFHASEVILIEPIAARRKVAQSWCTTFPDIHSWLEMDGMDIDVLIEASGSLDNVRLAFPRIAANGRVSLLARGGMPLHIDTVDHMITQAISIHGSRGHLGGLFPRVMDLYQAGLMPLDAIVTGVLPGIEALHAALLAPGDIAKNHCKVLARLGD